MKKSEQIKKLEKMVAINKKVIIGISIALSITIFMLILLNEKFEIYNDINTNIQKNDYIKQQKQINKIDNQVHQNTISLKIDDEKKYKSYKKAVADDISFN